jgi:hypothetical protein
MSEAMNMQAADVGRHKQDAIDIIIFHATPRKVAERGRR